MQNSVKSSGCWLSCSCGLYSVYAHVRCYHRLSAFVIDSRLKIWYSLYHLYCSEGCATRAITLARRDGRFFSSWPSGQSGQPVRATRHTAVSATCQPTIPYSECSSSTGHTCPTKILPRLPSLAFFSYECEACATQAVPKAEHLGGFCTKPTNSPRWKLVLCRAPQWDMLALDHCCTY